MIINNNKEREDKEKKNMIKIKTRTIMKEINSKMTKEFMMKMKTIKINYKMDMMKKEEKKKKKKNMKDKTKITIKIWM